MKTKYVFGFLLTAFLLSSCFVADEMQMEKKRERLKKEGITCTAEILSVEDLRETLNDNPRVKMTLLVQPEGKDEFEAEVKMVVSRVAIPRKGDLVTVHYNPNDKTDIVVD